MTSVGAISDIVENEMLELHVRCVQAKDLISPNMFESSSSLDAKLVNVTKFVFDSILVAFYIELCN